MSTDREVVPAIVAHVEETADLQPLAQELRSRYAANYDVRCTSLRAEAAADLAEMRASGVPVAPVLADRWRTSPDTPSVLDEASELHPHAKRILLIDWGAWREPATAAAVLEAMETGGNECARRVRNRRCATWIHQASGVGRG